MPYISRSIEKTILEISKSFPALLVTGPRQVGKTTMLRMLDPARTYVTLDDPMVRDLANREPALFLQRFEPPMLIDEIQYAPALLPYIKMRVDRSPAPGQYWMTGSQLFHMMKGASESLAGRVGVVSLPGLTRAEILGQPDSRFEPRPDWLKARSALSPELDLMELYRLIFRGGMPALEANPQTNLNIYFTSYVQTYLQRDVRDLTQVGDELSFLRFLTVAAARTGQLLNYAELAKDAGVSQPTAKQWLSILVTTGLVYLLEPYFNNLLKRVIKTPKLYFMDTGLCSYLTRWSGPETLEAGAMSGAMLETWIVGEIVKSYQNQVKRPPLYFYRDRDQKEIDLLIAQDDVIHPFEIKKSGNPGRDAIRHFKVLEQTGQRIGFGGVICLCDELLPADQMNWYIPVRLI